MPDECRPSRRGVSRNASAELVEPYDDGRPSRRGVSRNTAKFTKGKYTYESPLPQGRE